MFEGPMLCHTPDNNNNVNNNNTNINNTPDFRAVISGAGSEFESVYRVPGPLPDTLGDLV